MKMTFEQVQQILLDHGFKAMTPDNIERNVIILGKFGLNYCSCCERQDGIITIYCQKDDPELWIEGTDNGSSWNDPLTKTTLRDSMKWLGITMKKTI